MPFSTKILATSLSEASGPIDSAGVVMSSCTRMTPPCELALIVAVRGRGDIRRKPSSAAENYAGLRVQPRDECTNPERDGCE